MNYLRIKDSLAVLITSFILVVSGCSSSSPDKSHSAQMPHKLLTSGADKTTQSSPQNKVNFSTYNINKKYFNDVKGFVDLKLKLPRLDGNYKGIPAINKYFAGKEKFFYNELPLDDLKEANVKVEGKKDNWYRSADYKLEAVMGNIVSVSADLNGGSGGVAWDGVEGDTFDLNTGKKLNLGDIFKVSKDEYMKFIYGYVSKEITTEVNNNVKSGEVSLYYYDDAAYSSERRKVIQRFDPS